MPSFLNQFPNLLLDEHASFNFHEAELHRIRREKRIAKHRALEALTDDDISEIGEYNYRVGQLSLVRRVFLHDMLPAGACGRYDTDGDSYVITDKKLNIEHVTSTDLFVPTHEFARAKIKSRKRAVDWFVRKEHDALFGLLSKSTQMVTEVGDLTAAGINSAFRQIEQHDGVVVTILVGDWALSVIDKFGSDFYDRPSYAESMYLPNFRGHLYTANIYYSSHPALANKTYFLPAPDSGGVFVDRGDMTINGEFHSENWGQALVNPYMISALESV